VSSMLELLLTWALVWAFGAVVLYIVGRLGLGLLVRDFGSAFIASAVISVVSGLIHGLLGFVGLELVNTNFFGAILSLAVAALVLLISDRFVKGMIVSGFVGAMIAAVSYGVVAWLLQWVIGQFI
jgi:putative membrane protein